MKNLPLTQEQLVHLMQLLDLVVKAYGLAQGPNIATVAIELSGIVQSVMNAPEPEPAPESEP